MLAHGAGTNEQYESPEQHLQSTVQRLAGIELDTADIKRLKGKQGTSCFQAQALQQDVKSKAKGLSLLQVRQHAGLSLDAIS